MVATKPAMPAYASQAEPVPRPASPVLGGWIVGGATVVAVAVATAQFT